MQTADWRPRLESLLDDFRRRQADAARSGDKPDRIEVARAWHAELVDHQLAAPGWPREGGCFAPAVGQSAGLLPDDHGCGRAATPVSALVHPRPDVDRARHA